MQKREGGVLTRALSFFLFTRARNTRSNEGVIRMSQLNLLVSNLVEIHNNLVMEPENLRTNTKRLAEVIITLNDQLLAEGL